MKFLYNLPLQKAVIVFFIIVFFIIIGLTFIFIDKQKRVLLHQALFYMQQINLN